MMRSAPAAGARPAGARIMVGDYELVRPIGRGLQSRVHLVRGPDGQMYALKAFKPGPLEQAAWEREVQLLRACWHPNIVGFHTAWLRQRPNKPAYGILVTEWVPGESLAAKLLRVPGGRFSEREVAWIGIQLANVLHYLHTRTPPIIFRDLKPGNIMFSPDGRITLIDFGISRRWDGAADDDTEQAGTPRYSAPDQWQPGQSGPAADLYALAATLYHLVSGLPPPLLAGNPAAFVARMSPGAATAAALPGLERLMPALAELIRAGLAPAPVDRPPSAAAMEATLRAILGVGTHERVGAPPTRPCPTCGAPPRSTSYFCSHCGSRLPTGGG